MGKKRRPEGERVWLLAGFALAALFLFRGSSMVFAGAITGLGMFTAVYILMMWFPRIRNLLFSFGGITDVLISFGLPYLISMVMGIKGGTMLIATLTCGLMFTFTISTKRLGGPARASISSGKVILSGLAKQFQELKESITDGWNAETGDSSDGGGDHHRSDPKRPESPKEGSGYEWPDLGAHAKDMLRRRNPGDLA